MKNKIDPGTLVVAGDGAQQVVLPVAAPSASGSRPGLWPLPPQAGVFWTWERIAVKAHQEGTCHVNCLAPTSQHLRRPGEPTLIFGLISFL